MSDESPGIEPTPLLELNYAGRENESMRITVPLEYLVFLGIFRSRAAREIATM